MNNLYLNLHHYSCPDPHLQKQNMAPPGAAVTIPLVDSSRTTQILFNVIAAFEGMKKGRTAVRPYTSFFDCTIHD